MRVTSHEPDRLVIDDRALILRGVGGFLVALGAICVLLVTSSEAGSRWLTALGLVLAVAGAVLLLIPQSTRFVFDRLNRTVYIVRRGFRGRATETLRLRDIDAIEVDTATDHQGSKYRLVFRLLDGRALPWTSYYSVGRQAKADVAEQAVAFLSAASSTSRNTREMPKQ